MKGDRTFFAHVLVNFSVYMTNLPFWIWHWHNSTLFLTLLGSIPSKDDYIVFHSVSGKFAGWKSHLLYVIFWCEKTTLKLVLRFLIESNKYDFLRPKKLKRLFQNKKEGQPQDVSKIFQNRGCYFSSLKYYSSSKFAGVDSLEKVFSFANHHITLSVLWK